MTKQEYEIKKCDCDTSMHCPQGKQGFESRCEIWVKKESLITEGEACQEHNNMAEYNAKFDVPDCYEDLSFDPKDWRPKQQFWEAYEEKGFYGSMRGYMAFWWNVRQLVQELNGEWKPEKGQCIPYVAWNKLEKKFDYQVYEDYCAWIGPIGPFKCGPTAAKACGILNAADWAKGGVPG